MKRIYILTVLSLMITVGFAQSKKSGVEAKVAKVTNSNVIEKADSKIVKSNQHQAVSVSSENYVATSFSSIKSAVKAAKAQAADALTVVYGRPDGTFYTGYTRDYLAYGGVYLQSPAEVVTDYAPYSNDATAAFTWNYNGGSNLAIDQPTDADGTLHFTPSITAAGYISYLPKVTATTSASSATFVTGTGSSYQYLLAASVTKDTTTDGTIFDGVTEFSPLTLANMHERKYVSSTTGNLYGSYSAGGSFSPAYSNADGACVGVLQVIPQLKSPLYVESISALAYVPSGEAVPAGGVMKLALYYLKEDGSLGDKIAESSTNEFETTYGTQGVFIFKFQEEEDGFTVDTPVTIDTIAPVAVVITGFDSTWNFKFLFGSNRTLGSAYTLHGSNLAAATFGYSNAPSVPAADLYIQFNGIFNCLSPYDKTLASLSFPAEGGYGISGYDESDGSVYNDLSVYSSYNADDDATDLWVESAPEWVTSMEYDSTYFKNYNIVSFYFKASELPAGVSSRTGNIVLSSYGVSLTVPVSQGGSSSINTLTQSGVKATVVNNSFSVKYPSDFTSVTVLSISGKQLGTYSLSPSGETVIPAAYTRGIYLLKFAGAKSKTIKIAR
jgi:hypothetical protein